MPNIFLIKKPLITEKSHNLSAMGKYVFIVKPEATKNEIKKEIESLYKVGAHNVRIVNITKRKRRLGRLFTPGKRIKKAIVTLKPGQTLDIMPK